MGKRLSVDLAGFWICCSSHHSEQMSQWAELDLMSSFRVTSSRSFLKGPDLT